MTTSPTGAWERILDASSTREDLARVIDAQVQIGIADARIQIGTMPLTPREQHAALELVVPIIRGRVEAALTAGWLRLQCDAAAGTTIQ